MSRLLISRQTYFWNQRLQWLAATLLVGSLFPMSWAQAQTASPAVSQPAQPQVAAGITLQNQASYTYDAISEPLCDTQAGYTQNCGFNQILHLQGQTTGQVQATIKPLMVDPLGQITGCAGEVLPDYKGFSIGLYETDPTDPTGATFRELVPLTQTAYPAKPGSSIPVGIQPNTENSNPFFLVNSDKGTYNFILDAKRGQLDAGRSYVLVINPPAGSIYSQRRIRLTIGSRTDEQVAYTATSLDGKPISATDARSTVSGSITILDAARSGLVLSVLTLNTTICQGQEIQIVKTGDRAAAQPGDTVIYRLAVRNLASSPIENLTISDVLPLGFRFQANSVRAQLQGANVPVTTSQSGSTITFNFPSIALPKASSDQNSVLNIAYAATLTPDSIRGSGQNSAIVTGLRSDNHWAVKDGPAIHRLRIRNGILSDCGTIIGRVFVDKNFDGEQQPDEPGVPNAVIFLDDGTRIVTDANGLFSLANVLPGYRTGVLDLSSLPGYTLAPNHYVSERNSQSRLVHLEPSGMVRMNFAVTPSFHEAGKP